MLIIYTLLVTLILFILWLCALARKMYYESKDNLKEITHVHDQDVNSTVLQPDYLSEEEMAVLFSERVFFDCYKSGN